MKILLKKEVCGFHEQYTGPTRKASNTLLKKKKVKCRQTRANAANIVSTQTGTKSLIG